ncbi:MAG: sporulation transcriptional regulator SpoIIID [Clostridia bacterium]|nr:sporulation transcriptional regulator SpoIIID [Clostridia bacterium]
MNKNNERVINFAKFMLKNTATIRQTAKEFGYSKSTVHNDLNRKLLHINNGLYIQIKELLNNNFLEKHIRGGQATRQKYLNKK